MATLTVNLTLTSSDASSDVLSLAATDTLTTANPHIGISRQSITSGGSQQIIAAGSAGSLFVYVKNCNTAGTATVVLANDAAAGLGVLNNGEFAFIPIDRAKGLELEAIGADCEVEYAYWTRG